MTRLVSFFCVLFTCGCSSAAIPRLSYEGRSTIVSTSPTVVDAMVTVRNTGSTTANLRRPICPIRIAAYATPERDTEPLWTSGEDSCVTFPMIYPPISIGPRDYYDFTTRVTLPAGLARKPLFLAMRLPFANLQPVPVGQVWITQ